MNITILRQRYIGQGIHGVVFRAEGPDPRDATYEGHAIVGSEGALMISLTSTDPVGSTGYLCGDINRGDCPDFERRRDPLFLLMATITILMATITIVLMVFQ